MISLLRRVFVMVMLLALVGAAVHKDAGATTVAEYCAGTPEQEFLVLINQYRAQKGLGTLSMSQTLGAAAQHHALDMATTDTLSHTLSDGTDWLQNIINHGYPYGYRSENIAWGYGSPQSVFDAWKASSGHNANMLNSGFAAIGISRVYDASSSYGSYWVTTFGSQLDAPATLCGSGAQPTATSTPPSQATATATPRTEPTATTVAPQPTATATPVQPTPTTQVQLPAAPSSLRASTKRQAVQLAWVDNATSESGYRVQRSENGGAWTTVADGLQPNSSGFQDRSVRSGSTYAYVVEAYNSSGTAKSNTATVSVGGGKPGGKSGNNDRQTQNGSWHSN